MDGLTDHETTAQDEETDYRVELEGCSLGNNPKRDVVQYPSLRNPVCHDRCDR